MPKNANLHSAKRAKNDEFYTQLEDVSHELRHYWPHFKDKVVLCNCDDPYESNFFRYFALNFNRLGLKKLMATRYAGSPIAGTQLDLFAEGQASPSRAPDKAIVAEVRDATGDGAVTMGDVAELFRQGRNELTQLEGDGDFRSPECLELLDEADIVVSNPPFSLFREYMHALAERDKKFIVVGNKNAVTYKEVFPLIKENKLWIGNRSMYQDFWLYVDESNAEKYDEDGRAIRHIMACWFTNLDIKKRHEELILAKRYHGHESDYPEYDNYDAINVDKVKDIPEDYDGVMGVPITFLDKYCPEQFEILGASDNGAVDDKFKLQHFKKHNEPYVRGSKVYKRIFVRNRQLPRQQLPSASWSPRQNGPCMGKTAYKHANHHRRKRMFKRRTMLGSDGQLHNEIERGNIRQDLTTGEMSHLGPRLGNMQTVFGPDGVRTELHIGNMRQTLGGEGPSYRLFGSR